MKKNMGSADRFIRIALVVAVVVLYFTNLITGTLAIILLVVAGVFLLTSFVGLCPLYSVLGLKTCKKDAEGNC